MPPSVQKRQALGKGLGALIPQKTNAAAAPVSEADRRRATREVPIDDVRRNGAQPRQTFDDASLTELADSIREHGLMQPILVREKAGGYEIVAGERRWRACQRAGLKVIEVIVKDLADDQTFEWALIENIQREDLNPIEEAEAYRRLLEGSNLTQEQLAKRVSKDRSTVANALRLLKLPEEVRRQVISGALSMGHARAVLALDDPDAMVRMGREVVKKGMSVREVERAVRSAKREAEEAREPPLDPYAMLPGGKPAVERTTLDLRRRLGTKVRIVPQGRKGRIEIDYTDVEELDRLVELLRG